MLQLQPQHRQSLLLRDVINDHRTTRSDITPPTLRHTPKQRTITLTHGNQNPYLVAHIVVGRLGLASTEKQAVISVH